MTPSPESTMDSSSNQVQNQPQQHQYKAGKSEISSYPRIWKAPTNRHVYFRNAVEWMEAKQIDEGIGLNLWRVHDKLYNLTSFIKNHPGGSEWIEMSRGTDITEAFETSHVVNQTTVTKILEKYYVSEANYPRNSPYTFEPNGFYKILQQKVEPTLKKIGTGPTIPMRILQDTLGFSYIILAFVCVIFDSFWLQLLAGLVLGFTVVCAHGFIHMKDNWRKYYFDLSFISSYEWRLGHSLSHHLFPNTIMDYEVYIMEPFMELSSNKKRNWVQKYLAHVYLYILYSQYFGMELLKRINNIFLRRYQKLRLENLIVLGQILMNMWFTGSILGGFRTMFVIHSTASFYFSFVGSASAAHHHPNSFHEGDDVRSEPDFGLCQLDVTKNSLEEFTHGFLIASTTFGEHPLHHLFPTVCHSKLKYLQPVVDEVLEEFKEQIETLSSVQKFSGIHFQLNRNPEEVSNRMPSSSNSSH